MPNSPQEPHLDRARAGSFGSVAERYDRYRPAYPAALMGELAGMLPGSVLDVGCGTGKAAVALAARGLSVLGVEVDERTAGVARGHGVEVRGGSFETWDAAGRTFDLVTCADAWHWIDPARGAAKAAEVLNPGGTLARFWTTTVLGEPAVAAFDAVYREFAPKVAWVLRPAPGPARVHTSDADPVARGGAFAPAETRAYPWESTFDADAWTGLAATISEHLRLGPERLALLLRALRTTIGDLGGTVRAHHETYALLARRLPTD